MGKFHISHFGWHPKISTRTVCLQNSFNLADIKWNWQTQKIPTSAILAEVTKSFRVTFTKSGSYSNSKCEYYHQSSKSRYAAQKRFLSSSIHWFPTHWILVYDISGLGAIQWTSEDCICRNVDEKSIVYLEHCKYSDQYLEILFFRSSHIGDMTVCALLCDHTSLVGHSTQQTVSQHDGSPVFRENSLLISFILNMRWIYHLQHYCGIFENILQKSNSKFHHT